MDQPETAEAVTDDLSDNTAPSDAGTDAQDASDKPDTAAFDPGEQPNLSEAEAFITAVSALPEKSEIVVDAEKISEMTTPFLIAVISATKTMAELGGKVAIQRPSPAFLDAFSDLGLFQEMMKMEFRQ